jgi:hypothetical protein
MAAIVLPRISAPPTIRVGARVRPGSFLQYSEANPQLTSPTATGPGPGVACVHLSLGGRAPEFRPPDDVKQQFRGIEKAKKDR